MKNKKIMKNKNKYKRYKLFNHMILQKKHLLLKIGIKNIYHVLHLQEFKHYILTIVTYQKYNLTIYNL